MGSPSVAHRSKPPCGVAGFPWNQWQLSPGIGGSFAMESVAALLWNRWQLCYGISGSFPVESVAGLAWNTHTMILSAYPTPPVANQARRSVRGGPHTGQMPLCEAETALSTFLHGRGSCEVPCHKTGVMPGSTAWTYHDLELNTSVYMPCTRYTRIPNTPRHRCHGFSGGRFPICSRVCCHRSTSCPCRGNVVRPSRQVI